MCAGQRWIASDRTADALLIPRSLQAFSQRTELTIQHANAATPVAPCSSYGLSQKKVPGIRLSTKQELQCIVSAPGCEKARGPSVKTINLAEDNLLTGKKQKRLQGSFTVDKVGSLGSRIPKFSEVIQCAATGLLLYRRLL